MAPSRDTKDGKHPFLPKVHLVKPFPEQRQNSGYPQVVGKAEFPSQMWFPLIQPKLLGPWRGSREGRVWNAAGAAQTQTRGLLRAGYVSHHLYNHHKHTGMNFHIPAWAGGITFPQIQPACESLKLDPAKIWKSEQVLPAESANLSSG